MSRLEDIRWVQTSLNQLMNAKLVVDGAYGPLTRAAVVAFQNDYGIVGDGKVGPDTIVALKRSLEEDKGSVISWIKKWFRP
jgi:N-acetylmuramoyl-L-alanine amidase